MNGYIVVEGASDAALMSRLLPDDLSESVYVVNGNGRSSAISLCASLLIKRQKPAVLLLDADTTEANRIQEQKTVVTDMLAPVGRSAPFLVVLAAPEIETVLFSDLDGLENAMGIRPDEREIVKAEYRPKEVLRQMIARSEQIADEHELVSSLSPIALRRMAGHPLVREIVGFLQTEISYRRDRLARQTGT